MPDWVLILVTVILVVANVGFLAFSASVYVREYIKDRKLWRKRRETRRRTIMAASTAVVPMNEAQLAWQNEGDQQQSTPPPPPPLGGNDARKGCVCRFDCCGFF